MLARSLPLLSTIFACLLATQSPAQENPLQPMYSAIHAGDVAGVERLLAAARTLNGDARYEQERLLFGAFVTTDPRVFSFVKAWLAEKPDQADPHIAAAVMYLDIGYRIRGERYIRFTYPEAIRLWDDYQTRSAQEALRAYKIAPADVVNGDVLMRLRDHSDEGPRRLEVLAGIMKVSPNLTTVINAAGSFSPQWGGSLEEMADICSRYAATSGAKPPISQDDCFVYAAYRARLPDDYLERFDPLLQASDDPRLDFARRRRALRSPELVAENAEMLRTYLEDPAVMDIDAAYAYDRYARSRGLPPLAETIVARAQAWARRDLVNEPYSVVAPKVLGLQPEDSPSPVHPASSEEMAAMYLKILTFSPYDSDYWQAYGDWLRGIPTTPPDQVDDAFRNAVVYSNYSPGAVENYINFKGRALSRFIILREQNKSSEEFPAGYDRIGDDITCPLVALIRIHDAVCEIEGNARFCWLGENILDPWRTDTTNPLVDGACPKERTAPLSEIALEPQPLVDAGPLP